MIGRLHGIVVDCADPSTLASFSESLLGMQRVHDEGDWVVIGDAPDRPGSRAGRRPVGGGGQPADLPASGEGH